MKRLKIIIYLVCISTSGLHAQFENNSFSNNFTNSLLINNVQSDIVTFYNVGLNLVKSPLQFNKQDFFLAGAILGVTAMSIPLDEPIRARALRNQSTPLDNISFITEKFGKPRYSAILSGVLYGSGLLLNDRYIRETGQMLAEALLLIGLITTGAKMMFSRGRPFINEGSYEIDLFEFESNYKETSLPSGHTSTAFTVATVLSKRLNNIYASITLYSMASLTAMQRIYVDKHWFSDTILGAAVGTIIGLKVIKLHEQHSSPKDDFQYNIYPQIQSGNIGMGLTLQF